MRSDSDLEKRMVEYIEDNGVHCPFCGFTGMERDRCTNRNTEAAPHMLEML